MLVPRKKGERALMRMESPFDLMRREFATLFDRFLGHWPEVVEEELPPAHWGFAVEEKEKEVLVRAEVPGFEPEEIEVLVADNVLTIRAEHKEEKEAKEKKEEIERFEKMERTVLLPAGVDLEKIEATMKNGVLEVRIPRLPGPEPRRIAVKT